MKPEYHARSTVRKYGGSFDDYLPIHDFIDSSKQVIADMRHRAMLHSAWGIYVVEKVFGTSLEVARTRMISTPESATPLYKTVSVRDIAERHILEDLGRIPSMQDWLDKLPLQPWMGGQKGKVRHMSWEELGFPNDGKPRNESEADLMDSKLDEVMRVDHPLVKE